MKYGLWVHPWDIEDEGIDKVIGFCAEQLGVSTLAIAASYHGGRFFLPHNPCRKMYFPEDGALYFRAPSGAFRGQTIQPRYSRYAVNGTFERAANAAKSAGIDVAAWTVCLHNSFLGDLYPHATIQNVYGDRFTYGLCPNVPDVQTYLATVVSALAKKDYVDKIQLETPNPLGFRHGYHHELEGTDVDPVAEFLLGLCFCPDCRRAARKAGIAVEELAAGVHKEIELRLRGPARALPSDAWTSRNAFCEALGVQELNDYLQLRENSVVQLVSLLVSAAEKQAEVHLIARPAPGVWTAGVDLSSLRSLVDRIVLVLYQKSASAVETDIKQTLEHVDSAKSLVGALRVITPDCRDERNLQEKVDVCTRQGIEDYMFYCYGLASERSLSWIPAVTRS